MSLPSESAERRAARFLDVYRRRLWGAGSEASPVSGPGSTVAWSANARAALLEPPYSLPDPVRMYREGGHAKDRQFLGLWQLPLPAFDVVSSIRA